MRQNDKETRVQELAGVFDTNRTFFFFDYTKMNVAQAVDLRRLLRKNSASLKVVKNRLALRALKQDFPDALKSALRSPTAIAYTSSDPVALAKALKQFAVQNKVLVVKGGLVEGRYVAAERFEEITRLAPRPELLGRIGSLMVSPLLNFLRAWQGPVAIFGRLLSQLQDKKVDQTS
jgi:large subunit ribosomal protein L10